MSRYPELDKLKKMLRNAGYSGWTEFEPPVEHLDGYVMQGCFGYGALAGNIVSATQEEDSETITVYRECFPFPGLTAEQAFAFFKKVKGQRYYKSGTEYFNHDVIRRIGLPDIVNSCHEPYA